ncbi:hypothetical protein ACFVQF_24780, partial [Streptomyces sp. NPDC057866]|uniref:hypothetical protein n=1 Tax=Streptomyces sp. NPDC057866 TaxID=3346268 RepID=UPI0036B50DFB
MIPPVLSHRRPRVRRIQRARLRPRDRRRRGRLLDDQYNGGAIAWATGDIPVLISTIILAVQW